jgi:hypothetical protein
MSDVAIVNIVPQSIHSVHLFPNGVVACSNSFGHTLWQYVGSLKQIGGKVLGATPSYAEIHFHSDIRSLEVTITRDMFAELCRRAALEAELDKLEEVEV